MKDMKKYIALLLALMMLCIPLAACSGSDEDADDEESVVSEEIKDAEDAEEEPDYASDDVKDPEIIYQPESNGIFFDEEAEDAKLKMVKADPSEFVGSWEATSDHAVYFYGNIDITIKADGTWTGNITEEDCTGTWEEQGDHLHMTSELFSFDLGFEESGKLIMTETGEDYVLNTVLTKK